MKNDMVWTKTLLIIYRYLERIAGAIDKIVLQSALNSSNISGQNYFFNNVYSISQRLIDLSQRKVTIINLKVLIEETLKEINRNDAQLLIEKYFNNSKCKDMAEKHGISIRTVFRKISIAEKVFNNRLRKKGYNDIRLQKWLEKESWINHVYSRLSKNEEEFVLSNKYLAKAVSM